MTKFLFLIVTLVVNLAHAEKADSQKPLHISASSQAYDGIHKITTYMGPIHMEKGTLVIDASRLEIVDGPDGGKIGTLFGSPEKLVTYRQKRDGGTNLWVEGQAEKIVYDNTSEILKLFNQAQLILLDGKKRTQESSGPFISYDSRADFMSVNNTVEGVSKPGAGFTNAVIYPTETKAKTNSTVVPEKKQNANKNTSGTTNTITKVATKSVTKGATKVATKKMQEAKND